MGRAAEIYAYDRDSNVVVMQGWPAQLTKDQLRAYTNWSVHLIDERTKQGKIKARHDGRCGQMLWLRSSVDEYLEAAYGEASDFF